MTSLKYFWLIILIVFGLSVHAGSGEKKETPANLPGVKTTDSGSVKKWLDDGEDFYILDARKAPDYESGHIPDAELCTVPSDISIDDAAIKRTAEALQKYDFLKDMEDSDKIVVYCNGAT